MQEIKLPVDLVNAIMGYLGKRPFEEVLQLIQAVQTAAKDQNNAPIPSTEPPAQ